MGINAATENMEAARLFMEWMTTGIRRPVFRAARLLRSPTTRSYADYPLAQELELARPVRIDDPLSYQIFARRAEQRRVRKVTARSPGD